MHRILFDWKNSGVYTSVYVEIISLSSFVNHFCKHCLLLLIRIMVHKKVCKIMTIHTILTMSSKLLDEKCVFEILKVDAQDTV